MSTLALGIDIGGTNTAFGLVDHQGQLLFSGNLRTRNFQSAEELARQICEKVTPKLSSTGDLVAIGIGAPNGNFHKGTIEFAPNLQWKGIIPLADIFQKVFGLPAKVTNDANAAAMGEMQFGVARNMDNFVVVTLGTGVGSGFVCHGQVLYGHSGMAGELGHIVVEPNGRQCGCGRKGCLETYASVTGFKRTVALLREQNNNLHAEPQTPLEEISAKTVSDEAENGDELPLKAFDLTAQYLARGLATALAITSPQAIVLAGGLARTGALLTAPLEIHLNNELLLIHRGKVPVLLSGLLDQNAAVLGAAALGWEFVTG